MNEFIVFREIIAIVGTQLSLDDLSMSSSDSFSAEISLPLIVIDPKLKSARLISFSRKKGIPIMASNCGRGSIYNDLSIIVSPTCSFTGPVLCMNRVMTLLTTRSTGHDLVRVPVMPCFAANLVDNT